MPEESRRPHPVDRHVGSKMRERRIEIGMSQERLAAALGVTFQQVQKYERATNRIGASRLYELAQILRVPIGYFFEGYEAGVAPALSEAPQAPYESRALDHDQIELLTLFQRIGDAAMRRCVLELVKSIGTAYFSEGI